VDPAAAVEGDLAERADFVGVGEALEAGLGVVDGRGLAQGRDEVDRRSKRERCRVGVDAAQAEGVADQELDGVGVGAEAA